MVSKYYSVVKPSGVFPKKSCHESIVFAIQGSPDTENIMDMQCCLAHSWQTEDVKLYRK